MLKNPTYLGFVIALIAMITSIFIYQKLISNENYFLIDNPTDQTIEVSIDDETHILAPFQNTEIRLSKGKHQITSTIKDSIVLKENILIKDQKRGLLNPTLSTYIVFKRYYGVIKNKDSLMYSQKTKIDTTDYFGEIKISKKLFEDDFYLNQNQNYPQYKKRQDSTLSIPKIFRKKDFISFYNQNYL